MTLRDIVLTIASYKFLKPFMPHKGHSRPMAKMIQAFGAPIQANDAGTIIDYLSANYGAGG